MLNDQFNNGEGLLAQNALGATGFGKDPLLGASSGQQPSVGGVAATAATNPWTLGNWQFTPVDHDPFAQTGGNVPPQWQGSPQNNAAGAFSANPYRFNNDSPQNFGYNGPPVPGGMSAAEQATWMAQHNGLGANGALLAAQPQYTKIGGAYGAG